MESQNSKRIHAFDNDVMSDLDAVGIAQLIRDFCTGSHYSGNCTCTTRQSVSQCNSA